MRLTYDPIGDILFLELSDAREDQRVREVAEGVLARIDPESGKIEGFEIQGFRARASGEAGVFLPDWQLVPVRASA